jgi:hypothetical protein
VDAVIGERGQALVLAVLALALAALTIVGLREAQGRILSDARDRRAGEAAVEAAGAVLADAQLDFIASLRDELGTARILPSLAELDAFVTDPLVVERSRAAAAELSAANGGGVVRGLEITAGARTLDLTLSVGAHLQRAAIATTCCRR